MVLLTHNAALMRALDPIDRLVAKQSSEFADLPPNRLRLRIGLGNRLLFNQPVFLAIGYHGWRTSTGAGGRI